jgi:hypothetical protein
MMLTKTPVSEMGAGKSVIADVREETVRDVAKVQRGTPPGVLMLHAAHD